MEIFKDIFYVGVHDDKIDLFEGQFVVPEGICYNSYVILDEKVAVFDTVDANFFEKWSKNLDGVLNGRRPDYLIVQHMEPDHSANIDKFMQKYENAKIVSDPKSFTMMKQYFGNGYEDRKIEVKDGDKLSLGKHELTFVSAPMVHWPEVIMTYDSTSKILFSADGFGKFGTFEPTDDWACEARRYYFGIVGKYGAQVQKVLQKASTLDIQAICPLHGPVLKENLGYYINLYDIWSSYMVESEGVAIFYTSVYGNTKKAVFELQAELEKLGAKKVVCCDLAREDMHEAIEDAFRYGKIVLATTTYNGEIFPFMKTFIDALVERAYQNRKIGLIENGSWAPVANRYMMKMFEKSKNIEFCENNVTVRAALNAESLEQIKNLAKEILA